MNTARAHEISIAPWAFSADDLEGLDAFYRRYGFGVLTGALDGSTMASLEGECVDAQERLVAGELGEHFGTTRLIEDGAGEKAQHFANYVLHITDVSPTAAKIIQDETVVAAVRRWLGEGCVSAASSDQFGYVYQDARPGRESSYTRIGWHSDWQSAPHIPMWPATAITIHVDATSPANGFLRVVPGSHLWATPAPYENVNGAVVPAGAPATGGYEDTPPPYPMPLRFEKVPGEIAVYADRGDILFHDCYLWHSAALATDIETKRRHVRGSWFGGTLPSVYCDEDFVKNAAR